MKVLQLMTSIRFCRKNTKFMQLGLCAVFLLLFLTTCSLCWLLNEPRSAFDPSNDPVSLTDRVSFGDFPSHTQDPAVIAREALVWMQVLGSYKDYQLAPSQLSDKYLNMSIAATILSGTGKGAFRRRYWSEKALHYGELSMKIQQGMVPFPDPSRLQEIQVRVLLAMALNYYAGGVTDAGKLIAQFDRIDKDYLIRTGFCRNKLLKQLEADKLILLPSYFVEKWI